MGVKRGKCNPCLYFNPKTNLICMVHGDDFVSVGSAEAAQQFRTQLESRCEIKTQVLGADKGGVMLAHFLPKKVSRLHKKEES